MEKVQPQFVAINPGNKDLADMLNSLPKVPIWHPGFNREVGPCYNIHADFSVSYMDENSRYQGIIGRCKSLEAAIAFAEECRSFLESYSFID